jgi:quercetin dioxygenase-like cupin family protein
MNPQPNNHPYLLIDDIAALLEDAPADSIISRTIHKDENSNVVLFAFAPGQALSEHTAASSAIIQILSGEAVIGLGEDSCEAHAGTWIHMQARLPHSVVAKTPLVMLLIMLQKNNRPAEA